MILSLIYIRIIYVFSVFCLHLILVRFATLGYFISAWTFMGSSDTGVILTCFGSNALFSHMRSGLHGGTHAWGPPLMWEKGALLPEQLSLFPDTGRRLANIERDGYTLTSCRDGGRLGLGGNDPSNFFFLINIYIGINFSNFVL